MKIAIKAMHIVGIGMQIIEWHITSANNNVGRVPDSKFPFFASDLLSQCMENEHSITNTVGHSSFSYPKTKMTWTGNKIDLVELIYAWEGVGCFNHGHANIKEIATYIEAVFNIDLGEYYGTFQEMRGRVSRTAFLDSMIKVLKGRMDEVDRKK